MDKPADGATGILQRLQPVGVIGVAVNSVYLTWVFVAAFFSGKNAALLAKDFMVPFCTIPISLMSLLLISNIRRKTYLPKKNHPWIFLFLTVPFYFMLVLFLAVFTYFLRTQIAASVAVSLRITVSVLAEIFAITIAVGAQKMRRLGKILALLFGWGFSIIGAFTMLGIFEKQHRLDIHNDMRFVFAGIFFHAANTLYLLYTARQVFLTRPQKARASR